MDEQLMNMQELSEMLAVSPATIRNWYRAGRLPKPIQFGPAGKRCKLRWLRATIVNWLQQQQGA